MTDVPVVHGVVPAAAPQAPAGEEVQPTQADDAAQTPVAPPVKQAAKRRAGQKGGKWARSVMVVGLGSETPAQIDLETSGGQIAILEAVVRALALGKTSGLVASSIVQAVKAAGDIVRQDQTELLQAQAREIHRLRNAVTPGR